LLKNSSFTLPRAQGNEGTVENVRDFPFVLSLWFDFAHHPEFIEGSKHESHFFSSLLGDRDAVE